VRDVTMAGLAQHRARRPSSLDENRGQGRARGKGGVLGQTTQQATGLARMSSLCRAAACRAGTGRPVGNGGCCVPPVTSSSQACNPHTLSQRPIRSRSLRYGLFHAAPPPRASSSWNRRTVPYWQTPMVDSEERESCAEPGSDKPSILNGNNGPYNVPEHRLPARRYGYSQQHFRAVLFWRLRRDPHVSN
jgi:hypothetical protein